MFVKLYTGYGLRVTHRGRDGKEKVRTKLLMPGQVVDLPHDEAMALEWYKKAAGAVSLRSQFVMSYSSFFSGS